jgi:hypothetical protein
MKVLKIPSLVLAASLQLMPFARLTAVIPQSATPLLAIIIRWAAAATAALGGMQAVSGASTVITSTLSAKGTNGVSFKALRLTTAPDQAHFWTAAGLPSGLTLSGTSGSSFWQITGTPTTSGSFDVALTAKDQSNSGADRTVHGTLKLTIIATGSPPLITTQPQSQTVTEGADVAFNVIATGTAPLSYLWRKDGVVLRGGSTATLALGSVVTGQSGQYSVVVSNSLGFATSQSATLIVNPIPPSITFQPQPQVVTVGGTATFTVAAAGSTPFTYQWFRNDVPITGANTSSLTLSNVSQSLAGDYSVVVGNSGGTMPSDHAALTVFNPTTAPMIVSLPQSQNSYIGDTVHFSVAATGTEPLLYQWYFNGSVLSNATGASLVLTNIQAGGAGSYAVGVRNEAGAVTSDPAILGVVELKITSMIPLSGGAQLSWEGLAGRSFELQRSSDLIRDSWTLLSSPPPPGTDGEMDAIISISGSNSGFYRIRVDPAQ